MKQNDRAKQHSHSEFPWFLHNWNASFASNLHFNLNSLAQRARQFHYLYAGAKEKKTRNILYRHHCIVEYLTWSSRFWFRFRLLGVPPLRRRRRRSLSLSSVWISVYFKNVLYKSMYITAFTFRSIVFCSLSFSSSSYLSRWFPPWHWRNEIFGTKHKIWEFCTLKQKKKCNNNNNKVEWDRTVRKREREREWGFIKI